MDAPFFEWLGSALFGKMEIIKIEQQNWQETEIDEKSKLVSFS